jgi:hypothetical protein
MAETVHAHDEPDVGRTAMIGAALGFVGVALPIAVLGTLGGLGVVSALGLGAFVGMWGGAGFGFMMGGTIPLGRQLDAAPVAAPMSDRPEDADPPR